MQLPDNTPTHLNHPELRNKIKAEAEQSRGNISEILALLRTLEELHRDVRDTLFLNALPTNRQALYALLREIEQNGGWPYIPRFKIQDFIDHMDNEDGQS